MKLIQHLIALILNAGHSAKQVLVALCLAIRTCTYVHNHVHVGIYQAYKDASEFVTSAYIDILGLPWRGS